MSTGPTDTGIPIGNTARTVFFQQAAVNAEAVSDKWNFNAYALIATGDTEQQVNWFYSAGALDTYGLDAAYHITKALTASVGYYYQNGDAGAADGSGVLGRLAYAINNGLTVGTNLSYDDAFKSRFSADIKWRFNTKGGPGKETPKTNTAIAALTSTPNYRDVRIHDGIPSCPEDQVFSVFSEKCETKKTFEIQMTIYKDSCQGGSDKQLAVSLGGNCDRFYQKLNP